MFQKIIPLVFAWLVAVFLFWQFFFRGLIPIPAAFMVVWYEPWKSEFSPSGVPTIAHKAVGDDIFRQIYPLKILATDMLKDGHAPLWNPYNGAGQPLLGTLHTGIANPFSLLLFIDRNIGWALFIVLQVPLLFLSIYWFVRSLGVSLYGGVISGIVMSLSSVAIARYIYGDYMYAMAGLPLILGCIERRKLLYVPLIVAFVLVSVQPQISVYIILTALFYSLYRSPGKSGIFIKMVFIGVGISAFQLIPTLELYLSANVTAGSSAFIFDKFLMNPSHLLSLLIPNYFGNSGTYNFWGKTDYVETVASIGMIPVALAFMARIKGFFWWGVLITLVLTLDTAVTKALYQLSVPVLSTSIPTRLYLLTTFFVAVLAGIGFDTKPRKHILPVVFGVGILAVALSRYFACPAQIPNCHEIAVRNSVFELGIFTFGAVMFYVPKVKTIGLILLLTGAGLYNAWKFLPLSPPEFVGRNHPVLSELSSQAPFRIAGIGAGAFATDFATQHRYFDTSYYDPLYIRRFGEIVSYANTGNRQSGLTRSDIQVVTDATPSAEIVYRRGRLWDLSATVSVVVKKSDNISPSETLLWQDETWGLYGREGALPRVYFVESVLVKSDSDALLKSLFSPSTDIVSTAIVETPLNYERLSVGRITDEIFTEQSVSFTTEATTSAFLVLTDNYFPGWIAQIDGQKSSIVRTNYTFRGLLVPKGKHRVEFRYSPVSFKIGLGITGLSIIFLGIIATKKRRSNEARTGIEPVHRSFADSRVTSSPPRH